MFDFVINNFIVSLWIQKGKFSFKGEFQGCEKRICAEGSHKSECLQGERCVK